MADQFIYCEGSMQKKEAKGKWVTYYCVLKGDRLWCFSNRDTNNPNSLVGSIKMSSATQLKKHKTKDGNYQFKIRNDRGEYRFRCSFTSDRDRWLMEISRCARGDIPSSALNQQGSLTQGPGPSVQQQQVMQQQQQQQVMQQQQQQQAMPQQIQQMQAQNHPGVQRAGSMPIQSGLRPQMEVPMTSAGGMMVSPGPSGHGDNLLPGQRIALEEQRRRGTSFHGGARSGGDPSPTAPIPTSMSMSSSGGLGGSPSAALHPHFVRGAGSSASVRSVAGRPGGVRDNSMMDSEYANQEWFYGPIPRDVAEDYIMSYGLSGSFLLRESESSPGCYSLSFKSEHNDVRHYKIVRTGNRYTLTGLEERSFPNIIQVVQYYVEVNEGWAQPLRRSDTGYQKHPGLRDDATPGFTSGFDLPQGGAPSWTSGPPGPISSNPNAGFHQVAGYIVNTQNAPPMGVMPMDRGGVQAQGLHPQHVPCPTAPTQAQQQWQQPAMPSTFAHPPPPPLDPPPPNMDSELDYSDAAHDDFANLPPPSPTRFGIGGGSMLPPPPPLDPPPF